MCIRDSLGAQLRVAGVHLVLGDVDGGQQVLGHDALGHDDSAVSYTHLDVYKRQPWDTYTS